MNTWRIGRLPMDSTARYILGYSWRQLLLLKLAFWLLRKVPYPDIGITMYYTEGTAWYI